MKSVLILGNGESRKNSIDYITNWQNEIWVCNEAYIEPWSQKTRVGTVHKFIADLATEHKKTTNEKFEIYTNTCPALYKNTFAYQYGWSTGNLSILQALYERYEKICLCGFDFGGKDIYQPQPLYGGNFKDQFKTIYKTHDTNSIIFIIDNEEIHISKYKEKLEWLK